MNNAALSCLPLAIILAGCGGGGDSNEANANLWPDLSNLAVPVNETRPDVGNRVLPAKECPRVRGVDTGIVPAPTDDNPEFSFNGSFGDQFTCWQTGPETIAVAGAETVPSQWFTQTIEDLIPPDCRVDVRTVTCTQNIVRKCSKNAYSLEELARDVHHPGPCNTEDGVGPNGCEKCVVERRGD